MNKSDLAQQVAQQTDLSQAQAAAAVDAIFGGDGIIASALADSDAVTIAGFGKFEARSRASREGRNPATGESVMNRGEDGPRLQGRPCPPRPRRQLTRRRHTLHTGRRPRGSGRRRRPACEPGPAPRR